MGKFARPKDGVTVAIDMNLYKWPHVEYADKVTYLVANLITYTSKCFGSKSNKWYVLRGEWFGGDPYGNGAILVNEHSLEWKDE